MEKQIQHPTYEQICALVGRLYIESQREITELHKSLNAETQRADNALQLVHQLQQGEQDGST